MTLPFVVDLFFKSPPFGFRYALSESLPYKYFFCKNNPTSIQSGDYISFVHPQMEMRVIKKLIGMPGDSIEIKDQMIFVEGKFQGNLLTKSPRTNKKLTPIKKNKVPAGYVSVFGTHPESYDSRYEEFGLIKLETIDEVLWPIF